jgi:pimeloyl-ACP methyl ester carboxylesterase
VGGAEGLHPVVLVHGTLDRAESFRRVVRRFDDLRVVTYDRRGYQRSRGTADPPTDLGGHVDDLLAVAEWAGAPVVAVGHSLGGDVVIGAALADPGRFSAIAAFEPPMPWLGFARGGASPRRADWPPPGADPRAEVESFFRRMMGDGAWDRLSEVGRETRRADGPAVIGDLRGIRNGTPFDVTDLRVPLVLGRSEGAEDHHARTVRWLADHIPGTEVIEVAGAGHGAHLSHPDAFGALVRTAVGRGAAVAR